jgi:hypothetical protein
MSAEATNSVQPSTRARARSSSTAGAARLKGAPAATSVVEAVAATLANPPDETHASFSLAGRTSSAPPSARQRAGSRTRSSSQTGKPQLEPAPAAMPVAAQAHEAKRDLSPYAERPGDFSSGAKPVGDLSPAAAVTSSAIEVAPPAPPPAKSRVFRGSKL